MDKIDCSQIIFVNGPLCYYVSEYFLSSYIDDIGCLQIIFDNIMNREIPWPQVPEELSFEAYDLIDK